MDAPSNTDDVIDSRAVIERIEELESEVAELNEIGPEAVREDWVDPRAELAALKALAEECEGYSDWKHGETLVRDSYFKDYAQELADDCGMIDPAAKWPMTCIDWEQAARELQQDYTGVSFDGVDYWIRCS